jgi:hypothetical protein
LISSDLPFGIFWFTLWYLLIYPLVSSDLPFGIFWFTLWYLLIYPLVSSDVIKDKILIRNEMYFILFDNGCPILVPCCKSYWYLLIYPLVSSDLPFDIFWFTLWYLLIYPLISSDLPFGIFWFTLWYLLIYIISAFIRYDYVINQISFLIIKTETFV